MSRSTGGPVAIIAAAGALPELLARAAVEQGRKTVVFALEGEADPASFHPIECHAVRWGEIGRMLSIARTARCEEGVLIGSVTRRPDFQSMRPDFATVKLLPRILLLMRRGDEGLLAGIAALFKEHGIEILSPLDIAPTLALPEGVLTGRVGADQMADIENAAEAARLIGRLDVGQGAVAMQGRVVALEDAGGTRSLLARVAVLRTEGRIPKSGGVLVKCVKPHQDLRLDLPTIGASTAEEARAARLDGVAAEAGRALLAGREDTINAFRAAGLFLLGLKAPAAGDAR